MTAACTKNVTSACQTAGVVTCEDTDKSVIYFKEDNETKVILLTTASLSRAQGQR